VSQRVQFDPTTHDFAERVTALIGGQNVDAGKVRTYAEAIEDATASNVPLGKPVLRADDLLPDKDWSVLASIGYMCDDPYTGASGVTQVSDRVYRVTTRLATRKASSMVTFTLRRRSSTRSRSALVSARATGVFTDGHQRFWDTARRQVGDRDGTRALIGVLLLHRTLPADAVLAGIDAALSVGQCEPDLVAVEARRHHDTTRSAPAAASAPEIPASVGGDPRPAPTLHQYDQLLGTGS